jgi:hypothetical protein
VRIAWFRRLFRRKPAPQTVAESGA